MLTLTTASGYNSKSGFYADCRFKPFSMSDVPRFITVCLTAVMLLVQPLYTGWAVECGCRTSGSAACSQANSGCSCCPVQPGNSAKHCPHCQDSGDDSPPPRAAQVACHCGDSFPVPAPTQSMPESSGLDYLNWMAGDAPCFVVVPRQRITQARSQVPSNEASIPNFKQVACCVWLI